MNGDEAETLLRRLGTQQIRVGRKLFERIDTSGGPEACWPWLGPTTDKGYAKVSMQGLTSGTQIGWARTHKVLWELINGSVPSGMELCHSCDNRICCNPNHLKTGTHASNVAEMVARGRQAVGARNGRSTMPERTARGSRSGSARLHEDDVRAMRFAFVSGEKIAYLARKYGVDFKTAAKAVRGETWRHL